MTFIPDPPSSPELHPCPICSRTFLLTSLEKHKKVCEKTVAKKRKVFDSSKKRTEGLEKVPVQKSKKSNKEVPKKSNWKEKHEEFLKTIRAAKAVDNAIKNGEEPPPVPRSNIPRDYIQCPTCERHFSEKAAERHINWCKDQKSRIKGQAKTQEATQRLKARTKYQAPPPGKKLPATIAKPSSNTKLESKSEDSGRLVESAKITGRSLGIPVKSSKAKSSPPGVCRNPPMPTADVSNGPTLGDELKKHFPRKETHGEKKVIVKANIGKDFRPLKNVSTSISSCPKLPSPRTDKSILERSLDDSMLDSYHFSNRTLLRCSKPFGTMAPRTVPGVRTNSKTKRNSVPYAGTTNGLGHYMDSCANSYFHRISDGLTPDEDEIDEIDISRHNGYSRRSPSPGKYNGNPKCSGAFTSYRRHAATYNGNKVSSDSDNRGSTSGSDSSLPPLSIPTSNGDLYRLPRFCHDCGTKYPIATAKYCCECGVRRFSIDVVTP